MSRRSICLIGATMSLLSLVACHNATSPTSTDTTSTDTSTDATDTPTVTLAGTTTLTDIGQTVQFTATATLSDGTEEDVTEQATWESGSPSVATVSASGLVTAIALGQASITATFEDVSASLTTVLALNLTRTWGGNGLDSIGGAEFVLNVTQNGTAASGPVTFTSRGVSFQGRFSANVGPYSPRVPFVITGSGAVEGQTCTMAISGYAQASNSTFTGSYSGTNSCVGPVSDGQLTLAPQ